MRLVVCVADKAVDTGGTIWLQTATPLTVQPKENEPSQARLALRKPQSLPNFQAQLLEVEPATEKVFFDAV